ncbi:hypothetical protein [Arthrobacter sp. UYCo732]|uniref:hypothetical protein n=1 Tax=Arthrobacter sp. UYCo732 TaxID=3156336 RepID=UPI0033990AB6
MKSSGIPYWVLGVIAVLGLPLLDPLTRARFWNGWVVEWGFPLLLLILIIAAVSIAWALERVGVAVLIGVLGVAGLIGYGNARSYSQLTSYAATVQDSNDPMPTLKERAPFLVAERQASSNLSGINGQISATDYLADSNHYSTLVDRKGIGNPGYAAIINQTIALTGQAAGKPCLFDEGKASQRMDGWFGNSLTRAIAGQDALLIAKKDDAWGYCDGDTPKIVVPVTKLDGWLNPVHVPAGVAIYDGKTGQVELRDKVEAGELPGPAVGLSYVHRINESMATRDGDWWSMLMGQSGLTDEVKDSNDPNKDNSSAFSLAYKDRSGSVYASPFTSRASSQSIEDVALLESGHVKAGERPAVTLYHLEVPRQSNGATADKIKADFSDLSGWATGLAVMEVIPVSHNEWAASIGLNQNVAYRVLVKSDGSSCLTKDGATVRCIDADGKTVGATPDASAEAGQPAAGPGEIGGLSNEELAKLQNAVTAEVLKRLGQK